MFTIDALRASSVLWDLEADRLTCWAGTRPEGAADQESQACRPSVIREQSQPAERRPPPSAARASPERSDRARETPPQAEPSERAERAVGEGRRPARLQMILLSHHMAAL